MRRSCSSLEPEDMSIDHVSIDFGRRMRWLSEPNDNPRSLDLMIVFVGMMDFPSRDSDPERANRDMSHSVTAI